MERMPDPHAGPEADLIARARTGDRAALEQLVVAIKDLVYNLAIRMLNSRSDAEDMTQEILIKVVTNLGSFRGESAFRTWVYRVASNHLLTARQRAAEQRPESFDVMGARLADGVASTVPAVEDQVLVNEAKRLCTSSMLACLDRDHRLAFILGDILELPGEEAAAVLGIEPDALRKRVSRARARMDEFMGKTCGIVDPANACRCGKQAAKAIHIGLIDPKCLVWANHPARPAVAQARVDDLDGISRAVEVFRSHPEYLAPAQVVDGLRRALDAGTSDLLD
jgi:RNA polymerase sigma factor (sigma-70 family)